MDKKEEEEDDQGDERHYDDSSDENESSSSSCFSWTMMIQKEMDDDEPVVVLRSGRSSSSLQQGRSDDDGGGGRKSSSAASVSLCLLPSTLSGSSPSSSLATTTETPSPPPASSSSSSVVVWVVPSSACGFYSSQMAEEKEEGSVVVLNRLRKRNRQYPSMVRIHPLVSEKEGGGSDNDTVVGVFAVEISLPSRSATLWVIPSSVAASPACLFRALQLLRTTTRRRRTPHDEAERIDENEEEEEDALLESLPRLRSPPSLAAAVPPKPQPRLPPQRPDPRILFPNLTLRLLQEEEKEPTTQQKDSSSAHDGNNNSRNSNNNSASTPLRRWEPFVANDPDGHPFETDLFAGRLLLVMRPEQPALDPYWNDRMFATKKRRILVQVQGKFKKNPRGTVYAGAEVSDPMQLGLLARGLSNVLLRIVEGFNPGVHSSFGMRRRNNSNKKNGNDDDEQDEEKAHIVVPAYSFFERFVATPPGQNPPMLGSELEESKESLARRRNPTAALAYRFNTTDTYTFAFYSMYVDLPRWQLVNLPIPRGDVSLKTFWHDSHLRICMYEKVTTTAVDRSAAPNISVSSGAAGLLSSQKQPHLHKDNRYAFILQVNDVSFSFAGDANEAALRYFSFLRAESI
jgi:hypothetical protein